MVESEAGSDDEEELDSDEEEGLDWDELEARAARFVAAAHHKHLVTRARAHYKSTPCRKICAAPYQDSCVSHVPFSNPHLKSI